MSVRRIFHGIVGLALATSLASVTGVRADDTTPVAEAPRAWMDSIGVSGHVEAGIAVHPSGRSAAPSFGQLFTDRAGRPLLNQAVATVERPLGAGAEDGEIGFRLQLLFGGDARYTRFPAELDGATGGREQLDVLEATASLHASMPGLAGGLDLKLGQYPSPMGVEAIDARGNFFYTHGYIFNFGLPFKHTGLLATLHVTDAVDVIVGLDSGVNTGLGAGDNNADPAGLAGLSADLDGGRARLAMTVHVGPENPTGRPTPATSGALRTIWDAVLTVKPGADLTFSTEANVARDGGWRASAYGVAQHAVLQMTPWLSAGARAEAYRDESGAFVAAFPGRRSYVDFERGLPAIVVAGGRTTYLAGTAGLNLRPAVERWREHVVVRPEARYDRALGGAHPFGDGRRTDQVTLAVDVILSF